MKSGIACGPDAPGSEPTRGSVRARRRCGLFLVVAVLSVALWSSSASAHPGVGIVRDARGNIFYTDLSRVLKIAPDGTRTVAVPNVHTHELFLDANGDLYGEHLWYEGDATGVFDYRVWRLTASGRLEDVVPTTRGERTTYGFVRDAAGNMYSARTLDRARTPSAQPGGLPAVVVVRRSADGKVADVAGGGPPKRDGVGAKAGFTNIRWIAAAPDGTLFVVDAGDVRKVARDGTVTTLARDQGETVTALVWTRPLHALMGLAPGPGGSVYVANYGARKLKKIDAAGRVTVVAMSPYPWSPTGVAVAPSGDLYVLEYALNAARVRRIARDGSITVLR